MNRQPFTPPFAPASLPAWRCPACNDGALAQEKTSLRKEETADSKASRGNSDWEPDWEKQRFSILLRCTRCKEPVFALGNVEIVEGHDEEIGWHLHEAFVPTFFEPPTPIIHLSTKCPPLVADEVRAASMHFWSSPAASANRLRTALERLMDDQAIAKKTKTKKGTFESLSLHGRLERFAKKFPEVGQALLAVKWLGNSGTHSSELTASDSLDGFELLSFALDEIFESKSKRLKALTTTIIKKNTRKKRKKPLPAVP